MPQISHAHVSTALHHCSQSNSDLRAAPSAREFRSQLDSRQVEQVEALGRKQDDQIRIGSGEA